MSDLKERVAEQLHEGQSQYTYFQLAAAASCIAFAIQRTESSALDCMQLPLGIAVICWGASFWSGCYNRAYVSTTLYANVALLMLEDGTHPEQPTTQEMTQAAAQGVRSAAEKNSTSANQWGKRQFRFLIAGAVFFLIWHILEMNHTREIQKGKEPIQPTQVSSADLRG